MPDVSVVIPVRDGGRLFAGVLEALDAQSVAHELVVCDSGSTDRSAQLARVHGARVVELPPERFSHGGVRNLLMESASGAHVALLSQDSQPAGERWLETLLGGFELSEDVAIVFGPYRARPDASAPVRLELERWFASLADGGRPNIERLDERERSLPVVDLVGRRGFFTDANACIARAAWRRVPFRDVHYAEDRVLALDMLRAGYAKAFVPEAEVIHSHDYTTAQLLQRCFDEWRGLLEVYGWREPLSPIRLLAQVRGEMAYAREQLVREGLSGTRLWGALAGIARHHIGCRAGALLGSRADLLAPRARGRLSLEGRTGFAPLELDRERVARSAGPSRQ
jgi:GT2 family glycosyltransferase